MCIFFFTSLRALQRKKKKIWRGKWRKLLLVVFSLFSHFLVILQLKKRQTDKRKREKLSGVNQSKTLG